VSDAGLGRAMPSSSMTLLVLVSQPTSSIRIASIQRREREENRLNCPHVSSWATPSKLRWMTLITFSCNMKHYVSWQKMCHETEKWRRMDGHLHICL